MSQTCPHLFARAGWRRRGWRLRRKWCCVLCSFETRTYDGLDRWALRPIHRHMSVAFPGFNTCGVQAAQ